jgi:hypothetical protein
MKSTPTLIPVTKWNEHHYWPSPGGLRHLIFHRKTNGFDDVVVKVVRRVLIDEEAFFRWLDEQNGKKLIPEGR